MFLQNVLKHKEEPMKIHEQTTSFLENVNVVQEMWAVLVTCYSLNWSLAITCGQKFFAYQRMKAYKCADMEIFLW